MNVPFHASAPGSGLGQGRPALFCLLLALLSMLIGCGESSPPEPEWTTATPIAGKAQGLSHISGLVVDAQFAYVTIGGTLADQQAGTSGLRRVALYSGEVTVLDDGTNLPQSDYGGIALDDQFVYWNSSGKLLRIPKTGGASEIVADENVGIGIDLVVDQSKVYWVNHSYYSPNTPAVPSPLYAAPKDGGPVEIVADEQDVPHSLVADENFLYWLTPTSIVKQVKTGGPLQTLYQADTNAGVDELAQDESYLYFGFRGAGEAHWALHKIPKTGGEPQTLVKRYSLKPIVVDQTHVYFFAEEGLTNDLLCKVAKTGGDVTTLGKGYASGVIAQDKTHVYFAGLDDIYRLTK